MHESRTPAGPGRDLGRPSELAGDRDPLAVMERRNVTVMFVDLVASTELARELDPEDLAELMIGYQATVRTAVTRYGGQITRYVGDGILVLFGWPAANENAAEGAVRAAMGVHSALSETVMAGGRNVRCHIGIATGLSLVGDVAADGGADQSGAVFGETPNTAARLQHLAGPGQTILSGSTAALVANLFDYASVVGGRNGDGDEAVRGYLLSGEKRAEPRFGGEAVAAFVGRRAESLALESLWAAACGGSGGAVVVSGEAGVGKSRLLHQQRRLCDRARHVVMVLQCSPFHEQSAYFPFVRYVEVQAGAADDDPPDVRRGKIEVVYREILKPAEIDLLCTLAAGSKETGDLLETATETEVLETLLDVCVALIVRGAAKRPVLIHVEDIHWIDPSSRKLLKALTGRLPALPALCAITCRTGFDVEDFEALGARRLHLESLSSGEAERMVRDIDVRGVLTDEDVEEIVRKCAGLPLFIEHCSSSVCAAADGRGKPRVSQIPERLHDQLLRYLEVPEDLKPVLIAAAALDQSFDAGLVAGVLQEPVETIDDRLMALAARRILVPVVTRGDRSYAFRHALVQTAAYGGMVKSRRAALHRCIAEHLEKARPAAVRLRPELIARHCENGRMPQKAVRYWAAASLRSLRQHANREADQHAKNGLALLDQLPQEVRDRAELELQSLRAASLRAYKGYGDPENTRAMGRTFELAAALGDNDALLRSGHGLFTVYQVAARYDLAEALGRTIAERVTDSHGLMIAHYVMGAPLTWRGRFSEAQEALRLAETHGERHLKEVPEKRADAGALVQIDVMLGLVEAFLGLGDFGAVRVLRSVDRALETGRLLTIANAAHIACHAAQMTRHPDLERHLKVLENVAGESGFPFYEAGAVCLRGGVLAKNGEWSAALEHIRRGYNGLEATGCRASGPYMAAEMSELERRLGRFDAALATVDKGLALVERFDERNYETELHRIRGLILSDTGETDAAAAEFDRACSIALSQSARLFGLRAAADLAERAASPVQAEGARRRIAAILAEIPDAAGPDIDRARALAR